VDVGDLIGILVVLGVVIYLGRHLLEATLDIDPVAMYRDMEDE
jgi:hypothetical protein